MYKSVNFLDQDSVLKGAAGENLPVYAPSRTYIGPHPAAKNLSAVTRKVKDATLRQQNTIGANMYRNNAYDEDLAKEMKDLKFAQQYLVLVRSSLTRRCLSPENAHLPEVNSAFPTPRALIQRTPNKH